MNLSELRSALVAAFGSITGLSFSPHAVDGALLPHAWVQSIESTPITHWDTAHEHVVTIYVAVGSADDAGAVALIDQFIDEGVLANALRTIGAVERYESVGEQLSVLGGVHHGFIATLRVYG